jgi:hypothetical protein
MSLYLEHVSTTFSYAFGDGVCDSPAGCSDFAYTLERSIFFFVFSALVPKFAFISVYLCYFYDTCPAHGLAPFFLEVRLSTIFSTIST